MNDDYSKFAEAAPAPEQVSSLSDAALEMYEAELEVSRAQADLKTAQRRLADISERLLPDLMEETGMATMVLSNGVKIEVKDQLTVSPLKANRPQVLEWIRETGHAAKIKRNVVVSLGKDADEREQALMAELDEEGFKDVSVDEWIEPMTLKAHVSKALAAGEQVDMDLLNARLFKKAKITGKPKDGSSAFGE